MGEGYLWVVVVVVVVVCLFVCLFLLLPLGFPDTAAHPAGKDGAELSSAVCLSLWCLVPMHTGLERMKLMSGMGVSEGSWSSSECWGEEISKDFSITAFL